MITHRQTYTLTSDGSTGQIQGTQIEVGNAEIAVSVPIPAGSVNYPIALSWTYEDMQSLGLRSDKNITIEFRSGTHSVMSVLLIANSPYIWSKSNGYWPSGFDADPAWLEVSADGACTLQIMVLMNI